MRRIEDAKASRRASSTTIGSSKSSIINSVPSADIYELGESISVVNAVGLRKVGTVKYFGNVHFSTGNWVGVELPDASGKNDGLVQGTRYFTCKPKHGMLVRSSVCAKVKEGKEKIAARSASLYLDTRTDGSVDSEPPTPSSASTTSMKPSPYAAAPPVPPLPLPHASGLPSARSNSTIISFSAEPIVSPCEDSSGGPSVDAFKSTDKPVTTSDVITPTRDREHDYNVPLRVALRKTTEKPDPNVASAIKPKILSALQPKSSQKYAPDEVMQRIDSLLASSSAAAALETPKGSNNLFTRIAGNGSSYDGSYRGLPGQFSAPVHHPELIDVLMATLLANDDFVSRIGAAVKPSQYDKMRDELMIGRIEKLEACLAGLESHLVTILKGLDNLDSRTGLSNGGNSPTILPSKENDILLQRDQEIASLRLALQTVMTLVQQAKEDT